MALRQRVPFGNVDRKPTAVPLHSIAPDDHRYSPTSRPYTPDSHTLFFKKGPLSRVESFLRTDRGILTALTILSFLTRFFRLSRPANVVFDELHFGGFMEKLLEGKFVFDIHPWLGKLTLMAFARLTGYRSQNFKYEVGKPYTNGDYYYARIPSAFFGSLCVPLMYLIARELDLSKVSSLATAWLPLFDILLLLESRFILIDAQLMCYLKCALLCALRLFRIAEDGRRASVRYVAYLAATAISCAAAMSVKWTAGATPLLIALTCAFGMWRLRRPLPLLDCLLAAIIGIAVYVLPWYAFTRIGTTSTVGATRMSMRFRSTLHGNLTVPFNATNDVSFGEKLYDLHRRQFVANKKVRTRHHYESRWYEWPLNLRGIFFFVAEEPDFTKEKPYIRAIYLIQNPAGALWVLAAVVTVAISIPIFWRYRFDIAKERSAHRLYNMGSFLLCGYFVNLLPYIFVERCYFLYHYLPALTYGQLIFGVLIDSLPKIPRNIIAFVMMTSVLAAFIFWSPWAYGFRLHLDGFKKRQWIARWD